MKKIDIQEQKEIQLEILKYTFNLCEKNNLTCFLGGGTLLGAVRHNGYIPWDDDIDIMLPRKDYEVLLKIFNQQEEKKFGLLSFYNTNDYYYSYAKIIDKRTKLEEIECKEIKDMGVYIDVFPIDFLPEDSKRIKKIFDRYKMLQKLNSIHLLRSLDEGNKNKLKVLLKKILLPILKKDNVRKWILRKMDDIGKEYNDTSKVACISGRYSEKEVMPSEYISNYAWVKFEGNEFKVPIGYDEYLTKHYGDYMKLPPKEKQISNHSNIVYWRMKGEI